MAKNIRKFVSRKDLVADYTINAREQDNYALEALIPQIIEKRKVITPLIVEPHPTLEGKFLILQGNRRFRASDIIIGMNDVSDEIKENLSRFECSIYEGLTEDERMRFIYDHGETHPLNRTETLKAVWRWYAEMKTEKQIAIGLYGILATYTGNQKKANNVPKDPAAREKYLSDWFRGTLGQYMLSAYGMSDRVRNAMLLSHKKDDGKLGDTPLPWYASRERILALAKAKNADPNWTHEKGGEKFNELIEQFENEDAGKAEKEKVKRPTAQALLTQADASKSPLTKAALRVAAGQTEHGRAMIDLDSRAARTSDALVILSSSSTRFPYGPIRDLASALLGTGPIADVEAACKDITNGILVRDEPSPVVTVPAVPDVPVTDELYENTDQVNTDQVNTDQVNTDQVQPADNVTGEYDLVTGQPTELVESK
jgi:hypothetical protein